MSEHGPEPLHCGCYPQMGDSCSACDLAHPDNRAPSETDTLRAEVSRLTAELEAAKAWREVLEQDLEVAATSVEALMDEQEPMVQEIATMRARIEAGIAAAVCVFCGGAPNVGCRLCNSTGRHNRVVAALRGEP